MTRTWKVSYEDIRDKLAHYPFWKRTSFVEAGTRLEAIQKIKSMFPEPKYGNYRASARSDGAA